MRVQSVFVAKTHCPTRRAVRAWGKSHGFKIGKIEETLNFWRLVQAPSCACSRGTIRTTAFSETKNIKAAVCRPRKGAPFNLSSPCASKRHR